MDLELTADQDELRRVASDFLDRHAPLSLARTFLEDPGQSAPLHAELAELGWYSVGLEDDDPFGVIGLCLLSEQLGARAAPAALIDTAVVARIVAGASEEVRDRWLSRFARGEITAALAITDPDGGLGGAGSQLEIEAAGAGAYRVTGRKVGVVHGTTVDLIAVIGQADGEPVCVLLEPRIDGITIEAQEDLDAASSPAAVTLADAIAGTDSAIVGAAEAIDMALAVGHVAVAAEALGAAGRALDLAREYSLEREQFGRPIGSFQALAHLIADQHMLRETSRSTVLYAAGLLDEHSGDAREATAVAKAYVSNAALQIAEGALQVLGGVGFTWEHDFHLLHRRVLAAQRRFGDEIYHQNWLGRHLVAGYEVMT